jgi:hypothetical protein
MGPWLLTLTLAISWSWPGAEATCYYPSESTGTSESPAPAAEGTSSSNLGPIIGGAVGGAVGLALAVLLGWFLGRRRGGTTATTGVDEKDSGAAPAWGLYEAPGTGYPPVQNPRYEMLVPPAEMYAKSPHHELPGGYR